MNDFSPGYAVAFTTLQRKECRDARLVLEAIGLDVETTRQAGEWLVLVPQEELPRAIAELDAYRQENPQRADEQAAPVPVYGGGVVGVLLYAICLLLIDTFARTRGLDHDWLAAGDMVAGQVLSGQWWRVVTALTLHVDAGHILSNLVFGTVFGLLAGRVLGGGVAWLTIVIAGSLGNYMNALVQPAEHTSIGASTAVFAALGVIVAHALRHRTPGPQRALLRWSPLIGGVVLFGLLGIGGQRTDVMAHLTGLLAGMSIGWFGSRIPNRWLSNPIVQTSAGILAIAVVAAAWRVGLKATG